MAVAVVAALDRDERDDDNEARSEGVALCTVDGVLQAEAEADEVRRVRFGAAAKSAPGGRQQRWRRRCSR